MKDICWQGRKEKRHPSYCTICIVYYNIIIILYLLVQYHYNIYIVCRDFLPPPPRHDAVDRGGEGEDSCSDSVRPHDRARVRYTSSNQTSACSSGPPAFTAIRHITLLLVYHIRIHRSRLFTLCLSFYDCTHT